MCRFCNWASSAEIIIESAKCEAAPRLLPPHFAAQAFVNCVRIVANARLEHDFRFFDRSDVFGEVAIQQDQISLLARSDRADAFGLAERCGAILRGDVNYFHRRKTGFREQFDIALVAQAGKRVTIARGIAARHQHAAGRHTYNRADYTCAGPSYHKASC